MFECSHRYSILYKALCKKKKSMFIPNAGPGCPVPYGTVSRLSCPGVGFGMHVCVTNHRPLSDDKKPIAYTGVNKPEASSLSCSFSVPISLVCIKLISLERETVIFYL